MMENTSKSVCCIADFPEAFNLPNHVNPNNPSIVSNSATFGKSTSAFDPRIMQLALKYVF